MKLYHRQITNLLVCFKSTDEHCSHIRVNFLVNRQCLTNRKMFSALIIQSSNQCYHTRILEIRIMRCVHPKNHYVVLQGIKRAFNSYFRTSLNFSQASTKHTFGTRNPHEAPPILQFTCMQIFKAMFPTKRLVRVLDSIHWDGVGTVVRQNFLTALYTSSLRDGRIIMTNCICINFVCGVGNIKHCGRVSLFTQTKNMMWFKNL